MTSCCTDLPTGIRSMVASLNAGRLPITSVRIQMQVCTSYPLMGDDWLTKKVRFSKTLAFSIASAIALPRADRNNWRWTDTWARGCEIRTCDSGSDSYISWARVGTWFRCLACKGPVSGSTHIACLAWSSVAMPIKTTLTSDDGIPSSSSTSLVLYSTSHLKIVLERPHKLVDLFCHVIFLTPMESLVLVL